MNTDIHKLLARGGLNDPHNNKLLHYNIELMITERGESNWCD